MQKIVLFKHATNNERWTEYIKFIAGIEAHCKMEGVVIYRLYEIVTL